MGTVMVSRSAKAALLFFAAVGLLAGPALAEPRKVAAAAVALEPSLEGEAILATAALEASLARDARVNAVSLANLARGGQDERREKAGLAAKLLPQAVDAFDAMEFASAVAKARSAIVLYEESDLRESMGSLLDAIAIEALALFAQGKKGDARTSMNRLLSLKPDYKWNPARLTPEASKLCDEARAKLRSRPKGALEVRTQPVPALVFVDGVLRGTSPVALTDLVAGSHYVSAYATGYALSQEKGFAGPGGATALALSPLADGQRLLALLQGLRDAPGPDAAGALASWAKADEMLAVTLKSAGRGLFAAALRVDARGRLVAKAEKALAGRGEAARADLDALARELLSAAEGPRADSSTTIGAPPPPPRQQPEVARASGGSSGAGRAAGFALLGVGLAAGVTGLTLGLHVQNLANKARATPQVDQAGYDRLVSDGKTRALAADAMYGVCAATLITSIILLATQPAASDAPTATVAPVPGGAAFALNGRF
jgi:hypothetical protein